MMRIVALTILLPFVLSCGGTEPSPGPDFIRIQTDGSHYMQRDAMSIHLTNVSAYRLRLQPACFSLQHLSNSTWVPAGGSLEFPSCTWVMLSPGQEYFQNWSSIGDPPIGTARIEYYQIQIFDSTGSGGTIPELPVSERRSNQFTVTTGNPL
jgi:hypothetical protein